MNTSNSLRLAVGLATAMLLASGHAALAQVNAFGLIHSPVGDAKIDLTADGLWVKNLLSSPNSFDGVNVLLTDPASGQPITDWEAVISMAIFKDWDLARGCKPSVSARAHGTAGGQPDQDLGGLELVQTEPKANAAFLMGSFGVLEPDSLTVEYYAKGELLVSLNGLPPGEPVLMVEWVRGCPPFCNPCGYFSLSYHPQAFGRKVYGDISFIKCTDPWQRVTLPTGEVFTEIDHVLVYPENMTLDPGEVTSIDVITTAADSFLITGEEWTIDAPPCYADCDGDGALSIDDFICFQTYFATGDAYADCDADGALSIDDFICFQTYFAIGC